jgi:hypothetical protein
MMKCIKFWNRFLLVLLSANVVFAQEQNNIVDKLFKLYHETQSKEFLKIRIDEANSDFDKWRAFPPLYYSLVKDVVSTEVLQKLIEIKGLCVGDPHFENFGYLVNPKNMDEPIFTINDIDDSVLNCSIILDLIRLVIGHRLITEDPAMINSFIVNYIQGLKNEVKETSSSYLNSLKMKAIGKNTEVPKKYEEMIASKICNIKEGFRELDDTELTQIKQFIDLKSVDKVCIFDKIKGGSAGNKRFVIMENSESVYELKRLANPAPFVFSTENLNDKDVIVNRLWGENFNDSYKIEKIGNDSFLKRPEWKGNEGVKLSKVSNDYSFEMISIMQYQMQVLGQIHAKSLSPQALTNYSSLISENVVSLEQIANELEQKFKEEFKK